ncbi:hypothetical protein [Microterricola viridarii]|uniref:DUF559 domain-containing protein n=1 Tax=Microterricola viridarii TaxID=412690 RepID=A0A1H1YNH4_9MICO|nr:hypothetical protein [Microterricola viridarii]SDT23018.1 hypothetical protein SAMN04489834_3151 [Microterricola viridarii]
MSARDGLSREELTAAGDFILSGRRESGGGRSGSLATLEQLRAATSRHRAGRGARALRWALERVRDGVDSPKETRLRLTLVAHGFPEPVIGLPVLVDRGTLLLHPDLAWPNLRLVLEYEGVMRSITKGGSPKRGSLRGQNRQATDGARREKFEAAGWRVIRVTADDLGEELDAFIERVRTIVAARRAELAR